VLFWLTLVGGVAGLLAAVLVPMHLRAIDPRVLEESSAGGKSLVGATANLVPRNPAVAKVLLWAAEDLELPRTIEVLDQLRDQASARPAARTLLEQMERAAAGPIEVPETPILTALRQKENRERLAASFHSTDARQVLQNRDLTNLAIFAPVHSAAGFSAGRGDPHDGIPFGAARFQRRFAFERWIEGTGAEAHSPRGCHESGCRGGRLLPGHAGASQTV
jgi:hypothetical protein